MAREHRQGCSEAAVTRISVVEKCSLRKALLVVLSVEHFYAAP
jgi:hypothetical protein